MKRYIGLVHRGEGRRPSYGVSFPDFPGCISVESSFEKAVDAAAEALRFHVEGMQEEGLAIPPPRDYEAVVADPELAKVLDDAVMVLVPLLPPPERRERVNVMIDTSLLREVDKVATAEGMTRSAFLARAARNALENETIVSVGVRRSRASSAVRVRKSRTARRQSKSA